MDTQITASLLIIELKLQAIDLDSILKYIHAKQMWLNLKVNNLQLTVHQQKHKE